MLTPQQNLLLHAHLTDYIVNTIDEYYIGSNFKNDVIDYITDNKLNDKQTEQFLKLISNSNNAIYNALLDKLPDLDY